MAGITVVMLYPQPTQVERFERLYTEEHLPLIAEKLRAAVKIAARNILGAPGAAAAYYKIEELYFPTVQAFETSFYAEGGQAVAAHAAAISSGGPPTFLICAEEKVRWGLPPEGSKI